ncbi:MAG TPA: hypothetical protein VEX38_05925 [Fimbriimonadaceae bacterium]|nr:hypothetical protein [Fimbriimonadaceae bacterium]
MPRHASWAGRERQKLPQRLFASVERIPLIFWLPVGIYALLAFWWSGSPPVRAITEEIPTTLVVLFFSFPVLLYLTALEFPPSVVRRGVQNMPGAFAVLLRIKRGELTIGEDDGVLSFEDGALVFDGLLTSFRIHPRDATISSPLPFDMSLYGNWPQRRAWGFLLKEAPDVKVSVRPYRMYLAPGLEEKLYSWLNAPTEASSGESVLPPIDASPSSLAGMPGPLLLWGPAITMCVFGVIRMLLASSSFDWLMGFVFLASGASLTLVAVRTRIERARALAGKFGDEGKRVSMAASHRSHGADAD